MYSSAGVPFVDFANATGEQIGIPLMPIPEPESSWEPSYPILGTASLDGKWWVNIQRSKVPGRYDEPTGEFRPSYQAEELNGLLTHRIGEFLVGVSPTNVYGERFFTHRQWVEVTLLSSPDTVNDVQVKLGRQPGVDAFKITPFAKGQVEVGDCIEGLGRLEVRTSTLEEPSMVDHDLNPDAHVLAWIFTPPSFCIKIQRQAQSLVGAHGEAIHLPRDERPKEVTSYIKAVDELHGLVMPTFRQVRKLAEGQSYDPDSSPLIGLYQIICNTPDKFDDSTSEERKRDVTWRLKAMGLMADCLSPDQEREEIKKLFKELAVYAAETLLLVEDKQPRASDSEKTKAARARKLSIVALKFAA